MTRKRTPYGQLAPRDRPAELVAVAKAAERFTRSRVELHDALRDAREAGLSLRAIAEASGVYSHEQVRRLISHEQDAGWSPRRAASTRTTRQPRRERRRAR
jgi:hypothetical protein